MIKTILFDLDGVVVDSEPLYQQAEEQLFAEYGISIPESDWQLFRGLSESAFYQLARERYGVDAPLDTLRRQGRQLVREAFADSLQFRSGFIDLQRRLRPDYRLGLVTSTPGELFEFMDARLRISPLFDGILTGGTTAHSKPHPEPYLVMLKQLATEPRQALVVEDSVHGLTAAWESGAWTIAITGSVPEAVMPRRHATIAHLSEITAELIARIADQPMAPAQAP